MTNLEMEGGKAQDENEKTLKHNGDIQDHSVSVHLLTSKPNGNIEDHPVSASVSLSKVNGDIQDQPDSVSVSLSKLNGDIEAHPVSVSLSLSKLNGDIEDHPMSVSVSSHRPSSKAFRWTLVACSFFVFSIASVTQITFGIFITELEDIFGLTRSMIGLIGACRLSLSTMGGIFCGPLISKYGSRPVALFGILLATVGNFTAAFTTHPVTFMLTFGLLGGLGSGIAYLPCHVIVQEHFNGLASRTFGVGIASCGLSVFVMVFSPLTRVLINTFGWRGALIFIAAWILQTAVPAAMFRPARRNIRDVNTNIEEKNKDKERHHGSCKTCTSFGSSLLKYFGNPVLRKVNFGLFLCGCSTIMFGIDSIYMRSVARAISVGIEPLKASFLVTLAGPFSTIGRCLCGVSTKFVLPQNVFGVGLCIGGISVIISALCAFDVFGLHAFFAACFAFCLGTAMGLQSTVVVDLVGLKNLPAAMSLVLLVTGTGRLIANPLIGYMFDATGGYMYAFIVCGLLVFLGGCAVLSVRCFKKSASKTAKDEDKDLDVSVQAEL